LCCRSTTPGPPPPSPSPRLVCICPPDSLICFTAIPGRAGLYLADIRRGSPLACASPDHQRHLPSRLDIRHCAPYSPAAPTARHSCPQSLDSPRRHHSLFLSRRSDVGCHHSSVGVAQLFWMPHRGDVIVPPAPQFRPGTSRSSPVAASDYTQLDQWQTLLSEAVSCAAGGIRSLHTRSLADLGRSPCALKIVKSHRFPSGGSGFSGATRNEFVDKELVITYYGTWTSSRNPPMESFVR
jgi:hypothetical protein